MCPLTKEVKDKPVRGEEHVPVDGVDLLGQLLVERGDVLALVPTAKGGGVLPLGERGCFLGAGCGGGCGERVAGEREEETEGEGGSEGGRHGGVGGLGVVGVVGVVDWL
jgi:hypothetical protein